MESCTSWSFLPHPAQKPRYSEAVRTPGERLIRHFVSTLALASAAALNLAAQAPPPDAKPNPETDTLIFANGEQLSGALETANSKGIKFKSPVAGELTVEWKNIKELRSDKKFVLLTAGQKLTRKSAPAVVPQGPIAIHDKELIVATATGPVTVPTDKADRLVDAAAFDKAVNHPPSFFEGWGGTASAGASLVRATQNSTTFNGALALERSTPQVDWLPPRSRSSIDYNQTYGTVTQPQTSTTAYSQVKTNIFHADAERDQYFNRRGYYFGSVTFDHNFAQLLDLQQAYGGGFGITLLKSSVRTLDFKGDIHYEKQSFLSADVIATTLPTVPTPPAPTLNLIGSTFSEKYLRYLPKGLVLNEFGSISPAYNDLNAYSAHVNASLGFPVFKGLGFNIGGVDDYLNNAPVGSNRNSVQFTTNLTYTFKPK